uniref:NTR domain-containing protein n=1 Tax=Sander lucioperca TaxID=283035 RepID=A0A8D0AAI4_SANLU
MKVMSAPNLLRVGTAENIFVECQDCTGGNIQVLISVMDHPAKTRWLTSTSLTLTSERNFQELGQITIPVGTFSKDPTMKQYVYLQAQFPDQRLEKVVLVSFQSGYIFIQTDKTLYTPNSVENVCEHWRQLITPEGIILPLDPVSLKSGIHSGVFQLAEIISTGLWKVVAKFRSNPQQNYSADFEVKEYVLPSFEVKLMPESSFFYVDHQELTVNIKATYLFGQEVDGKAYVVFGVMQDNQKKSFPSSVQKVQISKGNGVVKLKTEHITQTFPNILDLVGSSIYVAVSVLTESGGEMAEAELRSIQIVTSLYTITFKKTPKYFKPGMSFDVVIEVVNPDGSPAERVPVMVDPGQVQTYTAANGMAKLSINTEARESRLIITARTNDPRISGERQASATMVALPYTSQSNNYIHIGVDKAELELGDTLNVNLILKRNENHDTDITYLILSRGQLVKNGRFKTRGQILISLTVTVTKEMLPSFRIIAYYHTNGNEVVSDSVWVDVKDSCMGSLRLESSNPSPSYEPLRMFGLKVTGDPGATVGLVAVDKGVYVLNNKHRLTQKKVWDIVEKYDTGCTPGGGKDGMGVFYDAGLLFESNTASGTPYRQGDTDFYHFFFPSAFISMFNFGLSPLWKDKSELKHFLLHTSSTLYVNLFLHTALFHTEGEGALISCSYMDSDEIVSRTNFPESWLWSDFILPACPQGNPNCDTTTLMRHFPLSHSVTTWQFTGISLSRTHGICVGEPLEVIVRKEFFIDLRLPYSAVRHEQLEIKAILHNYSPDPLTVRVDLTEEEHVCSSAFKRGKYRQEVKMGAQTTQAVPFIIIPMKEGIYNIEVKASVKGSLLNDGIRKKLLVVVRKNRLHLGGLKIPVKDLVRNTPTSTQISVTGQILFSALVENVVSGNSMGTLIVQPGGSGESNMADMTLPVIAVTYLDKTNQWETVGFQKRNEALQHIKTGYQNELAYRKNDGSFAVFQQKQSSTWLTAYVAKVFAMAHNLVAMQSQHICEAIRFLILNAQQPDGLFREIGYVYSNAMRVRVLISLTSILHLCATKIGLQASIDKAVAYLERHLHHLSYSYAVAMTSYALANENKLNKEILYKFAFEEARPVVRWFNTQQNVGGGYGSTQATIMVYQALAEYWASAKEPEYYLNVDILLPGRLRPYKYNFNRDNYYFTRTSEMVSLYYAVPKEKESDCQKFNLSVQLLPGNLVPSGFSFFLSIFSTLLFNVSVHFVYRYKSKDRDATMSILDIGLLTGFTVNTNDLDLLSKGQAPIIAKYEMNTVLSERGSLIIYLDKVSHTQPKEITFRIHQEMKVGVLQPAAVSVYEYYDQTHCVKFYHPERKADKLMLCTNDECICAGGNQNDVKLTESVVCEHKFVKSEILEQTPKPNTNIVLHRDNRTFLSYPHCRDSLDLKTGKTYLIMGTSNDIHRDDSRQSYQYVFGERTWIEYWPTEAECQTEEHRITCLGMEEMMLQVQLFGCQQ